MKRISLLVATAALIVGCGSSSAKSSTTAATSATTKAPVATTPAPAAATTAASAAGGGGIAVTLKEFTITLASPLASGANTLAVTNGGSFPHEVKIIKADSFAALPKAADGSVDETQLASGAIVGTMAKIAGGASGGLSVTLAAGKYVVICNVGTGANNHAAKGMHQDVTIG